MANKELAANIVALRAELLERVTGNVESKSLSLADGDNIFVKHLPAEVTHDQAKALESYVKDFTAEVADVVRERAIAMIREDKDIAQVNFEMPMLTTRDKVQVMINAKEGMNVAITHSASNHKAGRLKAIFQATSDELDEIFKETEAA